MSIAAETSRADWAEILYQRRRLCEKVLPRDCRALLHFIEDARATDDFMGFGSEERYLREGLGLADVEAATWATQGLHILGQEIPISFKEAVTAGRRTAQAALATTGKVLPEGRPRKPVEDETVQIAPLSSSDRAKAAGISPRTQKKLDAIARKAPELLEQVKAGNLSVHAAAVQAGVVKPSQTWPAPLDPDRLAIAVEKRFPGWRLVRVT